MQAAFTLHGVDFSPPTYKVALALSLMGEAYDFVVTTPRGDAKKADYLKLNALGQVPILIDMKTNRVYRQSPSILEMLSDRTGKFGGQSAEERIEMREWMYWDLDRLAPPVLRSRRHRRGFMSYNQPIAEMYHVEALTALKVLEDHFVEHKWLVGRRASIADIDVYGVLEFAEEGGFEIRDYPNIEAYMRRFQDLKGFGHPATLIPKESHKG